MKLYCAKYVEGCAKLLWQNEQGVEWQDFLIIVLRFVKKLEEKGHRKGLKW